MIPTKLEKGIKLFRESLTKQNSGIAKAGNHYLDSIKQLPHEYLKDVQNEIDDGNFLIEDLEAFASICSEAGMTHSANYIRLTIKEIIL